MKKFKFNLMPITTVFLILFMWLLPEGCTKSVATEKKIEFSSEQQKDASSQKESKELVSLEKIKEQVPEKIDDRPPKICKKPIPLGTKPFFKDISNEMGLGLQGKLQQESMKK